MQLNKNVIIFTGPSLHPREAAHFLDAYYLPPVKRGDIINTLKYSPQIIGIIDGVFFNQPAVSHREILFALSKGVKIVGGASMGALRASELDNFGMVGVGYVYKAYKTGKIESDDDVAIVFNSDTLEQLSEALINMRYNFELAQLNGLISKYELYILLNCAKSIYYPKRTYKRVLKDVNFSTTKIFQIEKFLQEKGVDIKKEDAIKVLKYIKKILISI
jgi:TfuA protein